MSRQAVTRCRWLLCKSVLGEDHPATRAAFGRYVAASGGGPPQSHGLPAWVAWGRELTPGYLNRSSRRRRTDLPTGGTLRQHKT